MHVSLSKKGMPGRAGGGAPPKILISISATNLTYILHTMPKDIQERMHALIAQHDSALAALATLWQQPEAQGNVVYREVLEMYFVIVIL